MTSILRHDIRRVVSRSLNLLHPRAITWRYMKKHNPHRPIIARLGTDLRVRIYPHDVIGESIYVWGMFEAPECRLVMNYLREGMVFFDVGANLGQYTLIAASQVGAKGQVHSFEPSSRIFGELRHNVELNGLSAICTLNRMAVSNCDGKASLSVYEPGAEVYGSLGNQNWPSGAPIIGYEEVQTITLDQYVDMHHVERVDLIKMDIEGAELLALQGASHLLHQSPAPAIVLEMADINTDGFGYKALETWDYLQSLGYGFFSFDEDGHVSGKVERPSDFVRAQNLLATKE